MKTTMTHFIEKMIEAGKLTIEVDYEIVSFIVIEWEDSWDFPSIDEGYKMDSLAFFQKENITKNHKAKLEQIIIEQQDHPPNIGSTPHIDNPTFYLLNEDINLTEAMTFGLGVVQMLRGEYAGRYMLYNYRKVNDPDYVEEDISDEMIMLKLYFQYTVPFPYYDKGVHHLIENQWDYAWHLINNNHDYVREQFRMIFEQCVGEQWLLQ